MPKRKDSLHNNFFLSQFSKTEFALSFFQEYLPKEIRKAVDWKSLRLAPGDFVEKALKNLRSDILYEVNLSGKKGYFYLHLEHQRKSDPNMPLRMLFYMVDIWRQFLKQYGKEPLPLVFPMVVFQGKSTWKAPLGLHELLQVPAYMKPYIPDFRYELMELSHLTDEEIKGELLVRVGLLTMKHIDSPKIVDFFFERLFPLLNELSTKDTGLEYLQTILYYLSKGSEHFDKEQVIKTFRSQEQTNQIEEIIMTFAEQCRQEGMQQGMQQGLLEGEIQFALTMLEEKFGVQAKQYENELRALSMDNLNEIARRILNANKIEDIF